MGEEIEIFCDLAGLNDLIGKLTVLRDNLKETHLHLATAEWGGNELSDKTQGQENALIQQGTVILKRT